MATYDLDRWSKQIRKRYLQTSNSSQASLTLHLHANHCRFEHQNGVFLYESPIRSLLFAIRDGRLPTELLDLLDATEVAYFEGCLIVEVYDHRHTEQDNANEGSRGLSGAAGASLDGLSALNTATTSSSLGKRSGDGALLIDTTLKTDVGASSSSTSNSKGHHGAAGTFRKRFVTSYKRFEEARLEAATLKGRLPNKNKSGGSGNPSTPASAGLSGNGGSSADANPGTSIHSAVAAAVATADSMASGNAGLEDASSNPSQRAYRIVLGPDIETIWTDLTAIKHEKKLDWSQQEMLEVESRVLALTAPPLCLNPDYEVTRIANSLLDSTVLPYTPILPARAAEDKRRKRIRAVASKMPVKGSKIAKDDLLGKRKVSKRGKTTRLVQRPKATEEGEEEEEEEESMVDEAALERERARLERMENEKWMMVMNESHNRTFQPSFSRLAFVQDYREREIERQKKAAADAQAQAQAQQRAAEQAAAAAQAALQQASTSEEQQESSGSRQHSRTGSASDIAVIASALAAEDSRNAAANNSATNASAAASIAPKKKLTKPVTGKAGSPDTPIASSGTSLKLTLPGKKSNINKKKRDSKQGSPDVPVSFPSAPSPASSYANTPIATDASASKNSTKLPKAKLKTDIKVNTNNMYQSPVLQPAPPQKQAITRNFNPNQQANIQQQPQMQQQGQQNHNNASALAAQQAAYLAQLQANSVPVQLQGISMPVPSTTPNPSQQQQMQASTSSPYNSPLQLPNNRNNPQGFSSPAQQHNFVNIHRSPAYNQHANIPQQMPQQQQMNAYNSYNQNAMNGLNIPQAMQQQFTPQMTLQLQQQIAQQQQQQQQQNLLAQHQQALQNQVNNFGGNNLNFSMPDSQQMQFNQNLMNQLRAAQAQQQQQQNQLNMPFNPQMQQWPQGR